MHDVVSNTTPLLYLHQLGCLRGWAMYSFGKMELSLATMAAGQKPCRASHLRTVEFVEK